ncbi:MAG: hypothetical protein RL662_638, partial [Bacteroidota bacterium]
DKVKYEAKFDGKTFLGYKNEKGELYPNISKSAKKLEEAYRFNGKITVVSRFNNWNCTVTEYTNSIDAYSVQAITVEQKPVVARDHFKQLGLKEGATIVINGCDISVSGMDYSYSTIKAKCDDIISKIPEDVYSSLTTEEKFILSLPMIQWNIGFKYSAICMLNWMIGDGKSVEVPYEFVTNSERLYKIDEIELKKYFKEMIYISEENLGYLPSTDSENRFLFQTDIGAINKSYNKFMEELNNLSSLEIGDYNDISTNLHSPTVQKNNLFVSISLGSALGALDDIGASFGRFSLRAYFKGELSYLNENDTKPSILHINEIATRFVDEFSFSENSSILYYPLTWDKGQPLGCWKIGCESKDFKDCVSSSLTISLGWTCLQDEDFLDLKNKIKDYLPNFGKSFLLYTPLKIIKDEYIKKDIEIR